MNTNIHICRDDYKLSHPELMPVLLLNISSNKTGINYVNKEVAASPSVGQQANSTTINTITVSQSCC